MDHHAQKPGTIADKAQHEYPTAYRWFQKKRIPLYAAVGVGLGSFGYLWLSKARHDPTFVTNSDRRASALPDEHGDQIDDKQGGAGEDPQYKGFGKKVAETTGHMDRDAEHRSSLAPVKAITDKMYDVLPDRDPTASIEAAKDQAASHAKFKKQDSNK